MAKSMYNKSAMSLHKKIATEMSFCELNFSKPKLRCKLGVSIRERTYSSHYWATD